MSNVFSEEKRQQVIAMGRQGWPLRRIEQETGVRRETAGAYLKARRDRSATTGCMGTAAAGKTGQSAFFFPQALSTAELIWTRMSGYSYCKTDSIPFHCALLDTCNILVLDLRALRRSMHNSAV